jgi:hypothetical protein
MVRVLNNLDLIYNLRYAVESENGFLGKLFLKESGNFPTQEEDARVIAFAGYILKARVQGLPQSLFRSLDDAARTRVSVAFHAGYSNHFVTPSVPCQLSQYNARR